MRIVKDGNVCVEVYKGKLPTIQEIEQEKDKALSRHQDEIGKLEKEKANYQRLGFKAQAKMVDTKLQTIKRKAIAAGEAISPEMFGYQVISLEEMKIWALWLPTEYTEEEFKDYRFDQIPQTALDEYAMAKELRMFETFTIRTPEKEKVQEDPVIFGWFWKMVNGELKKVPVLITRWAESLRPFEEIKRIIKESDRASDRASSLFFWSSLMMVIGYIGLFGKINTLDVLTSDQQFEFLMFLFFLTIGIGCIVGGIVTVIAKGLWPTRFNAKAILNRSRQLPSL